MFGLPRDHQFRPRAGTAAETTSLRLCWCNIQYSAPTTALFVARLDEPRLLANLTTQSARESQGELGHDAPLTEAAGNSTPGLSGAIRCSSPLRVCPPPRCPTSGSRTSPLRRRNNLWTTFPGFSWKAMKRKLVRLHNNNLADCAELMGSATTKASNADDHDISNLPGTPVNTGLTSCPFAMRRATALTGNTDRLGTPTRSAGLVAHRPTTPQSGPCQPSHPKANFTTCRRQCEGRRPRLATRTILKRRGVRFNYLLVGRKRCVLSDNSNA